MRFFALLVVAALVALAVHPSTAHAQGAVATSQFKEGKKLYDEGSFADALQLFQLAWEHSHSPNARLYIARCFKELGQNKPAYDEFRGTLRDATSKIEEDEKYRDNQSAAAAELVLLEQKIGHLIISLDTSAVQGAKVTLNGEPLPNVLLGSVMTVDPGAVKIVASADGKEAVERDVVIEGGKTEAVALFFAPDAVSSTAPPVEQAAVDDVPWTTLQVVGVIMGAVGVAGLIAAGGTGIAAGSKFSALSSACGDGPCTDPSYTEIIDSGKTFEVVSYILLGGGGALAITGAALFLFGGDGEATQEPAATAIITPVPGGVFLGAAGSF